MGGIEKEELANRVQAATREEQVIMAMLLNDDVLICLPETVRLDKDRLTDFQGIPAWKGPNL